MLKSVMTVAAGLLLIALSAQNENDALRYSRIGFGGSARYSAMAGAFGALGGDMSVMTTNPAGLGFYRKNELVFTPSVYNQKVSSVYNQTNTADVRTNFRFDNFGFVFGGRTENKEEDGWQYVTMGIAYNRYNTFQANLLMSGQSETSMMDAWKKTASGTAIQDLNQFYEGLAYNAWLLNPAPGINQYSDTIPEGDLLKQTKSTTLRGGMGEWSFGIGANYSHKLYVGASVGISQIRYEEASTYSEQEVIDTISKFEYYEFNESIETKGRGINLKVGVIYRPVDAVRFGFAFHTPTAYRLSDTWQTSLTSYIDNVVYNPISPVGNYQYTIRTPMRLTGSAGFVFGKVAVLDVDYEFVDYTNAMLRSADYSYIDENNAIQTKYTAAHNIRSGIEIRMLPYSLRGGFAYYGSPYKESVNNDAVRTYITGGVGYRDPNDDFYVDFAIVKSAQKENYFFYDQSLVNPVRNNWSGMNILLTVGFRY
ncbi:MAG: outer membrane protein transport protein [Bacteroidia bacterium]